MSRYILRPVAVQQREQWDDFVSHHPSGHLLQSWGWGELKATVGWHPLHFALWDSEREQILAAAQVLRRAFPHLPLWTGHFAYIPKGPVMDWSQPLLSEALFSQLHMQLRRWGALTLCVELPQAAGTAAGETVKEQMVSLGFHPARAIQPLRTILLDLVPGEELLLARMKEKWRYNVRLASRKGVIVRAAQSPQDVQAWYRLLQTTSARDKFGIHSLFVTRRACFSRSTMDTCWRASSSASWQNRPSISMAPRATNNATSCPTTSCNGKPSAGPGSRAQPCTTSGVSPQRMIKMKLWRASIASSVAGEAKS